MLMNEFFYQLSWDQSENLHLDICHLRELLRPFARTLKFDRFQTLRNNSQ